MKTLRKREQDIEKKEEYWKKEKIILERENKLKEEKDLFKKQVAFKKWKLNLKFKKPSTSKVLIIFLFANCTAIEIFSCFILFKAVQISALNSLSVDFSPLTALIGAVVTEAIGYAIYAIKSLKENSKGGIVYETALKKYGGNNNEQSSEPNDSV